MGQERPRRSCHEMLLMSGPGGRTGTESPIRCCSGWRLPREEPVVDLNNKNKGVQGGIKVSSLKMPPGVLLF